MNLMMWVKMYMIGLTSIDTDPEDSGDGFDDWEMDFDTEDNWTVTFVLPFFLFLCVFYFGVVVCLPRLLPVFMQ